MSNVKRATIAGTVSSARGLTGKLTIPTSLPAEYDVYTGSYTVTPKAYEKQILATKNRLLHDDIVITEVPYIETSNGKGTTVYIAKEVN